MEFRKMVMITVYAKQRKRHGCTDQTFGLCGRRRGWDVLKEQHVYYLGWNRSPAQVGCMRQVLSPGALGKPRGIGWRGRWEGWSGWGTHVTPWLIHVNVWQNPLKCCEVISLQLINEKKKNTGVSIHSLLQGIFLTQGWNQVSWIAGRFVTIWASRKATTYVSLFSHSVVSSSFVMPWTVARQASLSMGFSR